MTEATANKYAARRVRKGKTLRDKLNDNHKRRQTNQQARAEYTQWCKDSESARVAPSTAWAKFPWFACDGKNTRAMRA